MHDVINNSVLSIKPGKIERAFLSVILLFFIGTFLTPSNRLDWFINLGFYTIIVVSALLVFQLLLSRFSKSKIKFRELVIQTLNIDNFFLAVSVLLLTINTITLQPAFENAQCTPILSRYYIFAYFLFVSFLVFSTKYNIDPLVKGIVPLILFSFITYSLPFEIHILGYIPHLGIIIFLLLKLLRTDEFYNFGFFKMRFDAQIMLLLGSGLFSTIFAFYPQESTKAFIRYSVYFMTYLVISRTFNRRDIKRTIFVLFLLFSAFLSVLFVYKILINAMQFNFTVSLMFKMWISQIHPNAIVLYTIMVLSFAVSTLLFISNRWLKLTLCLIIPCLLFLIVLTYSKTGYLALCVAFVVIFIQYKKISRGDIKNYKEAGIYKYIILLVLLVFIFTVFPKIIMRIQNRFLNTDYMKERLLYWELGSKIIKDHPIAGAGF
ncbi:O-antigen ligase family protein, partial [bacterium]|nr:O-antigen ligase family protein [bacterium]